MCCRPKRKSDQIYDIFDFTVKIVTLYFYKETVKNGRMTKIEQLNLLNTITCCLMSGLRSSGTLFANLKIKSYL